MSAMRARLLRPLPALAMLALAIGLAGSADSPAIAGAVLAAALAAAIAVVSVRAVRSDALGGASGIGTPHAAARPAPDHPDTPGRARPRAPGRGPLAA